MAAPKYLYNNSGRVTEKAGVTTSTADSIPALDASGKLNIDMMPTGIGADTISATASEALTAGNFVNIYNDSGITKCRKADATTAGKEANGFVLANVDSEATATVYLQGLNNQLTGLTIGAKQFLATSAGGRTETAPSSAGNVVQYLGTANSATAMFFMERDSLVCA